MVVRLDEAGHPIVLDRRTVEGGPDVAPPTDFTKEQITASRGVKPISAAPDTVVATLWFDKGVSTLKVENGFDHPIAYVATLTARRGSQTLTKVSSTCPVRAKSASYETWPDRIDGIAIDSVRALAPGDLACNTDSGLSLPPRPVATPAAAAPVNACTAGNPLAGPTPIQVRFEVSPADGAIQSRSVTWGVQNFAHAAAPIVLLDYPIEGGKAAAAPTRLSVMEAMAMKPRPPSPTATIVILTDGGERTRRPWALFAQTLAKMDAGGQTPDFFVGVVPFNNDYPDGTPDAGLTQVLADIGSGRVTTLDVRVVGAKGGIMDRRLFPLDAAPVHDPAILGPLLREAEAKATAPGHCAPQQQASR
jgi:hypothetical protein